MPSFRFDDIIASFQRLRRFPLETVISIALTLFLIFAIYSEKTDAWVVQTILSLIVTFFLSTGMTLFRESLDGGKGLKNKNTLLLAVLPVIYGIGFYFVSDYLGTANPENVAFFLLHLFGFIAILFVAPYLRNIFEKAKASKLQGISVGYSNYFSLVAWTKLMAMIVGGSVFALGSIAIGSIITLFDLSHFPHVEKVFMTWATISLAFIAPLYGLIQFPDPSAINRDEYDTNRFFSFLVRFVGMPAILVYFVILYAYSIRVLVNFHDWPMGIVSWMVIGFSSFGYLVYAFAKPHENASKAIAMFRKLFPFAVLPQILMLFYAIYLRIAQYDLTMNRYFVVIFGVWLTAVSIYFSMSKTKSLTVLPSSLAFFAILFSFGPWSVYSLPAERQYERLVGHMEQAGIIKDGKATQLTTTLDADLENSIVSEIEYVCEYRECAKLRPLFAKVLEDAEKSALERSGPNLWRSRLSSWEAASAIKTELNVRRRTDVDESANKYVRLSTKGGVQYPLNISGYDYAVDVVGSGSSSDAPVPIVKIDPDADTITIVDSERSETLSLSNFTNTLRMRYGNRTSYGTAETQDLTFSMNSAEYEMKVMLTGFSYKNPKYAPKSASPDEMSRSLGSWYDISGVALLKKRWK